MKRALLCLLAAALAGCATESARSGDATVDLGRGATALASGPHTIAYAPVALPEVPPPRAIPAAEEGGPPRDAVLGANASLADRFTAEGETVSYRFDARGGSVSLFELGCLGYSRGWESSVGLRILDSKGRELLTRLRDGGATYSMFTEFVAPRDGVYRLELTAAREHFRYTLVRHTALGGNAPDVLVALGGGTHLVGYLADELDRARIAVDLAAGEAACVEVGPYREPQRKRLANGRSGALTDALRARTHDAVPKLDALLAAEQLDAALAGELPSLPLFALELAPEETADPERSALRVLPAGEARTIRIDVVALGVGEGGLFSVDVARRTPIHAVHGRVGDRDDDPVAGVSLSFLHEPSLTPLASATTDAEGRFSLELPAADYSVLYFAGPGTRLARTDVRIDEPLELNLIYE